MRYHVYLASVGVYLLELEASLPLRKLLVVNDF